MTQTRGKPTRALLHGGGPRRTIEAETVAAALVEHELPSDAATVETLTERFNSRLAMVDCQPRTLRDAPEIRKIAKAARRLNQALEASDARRDIEFAMICKFLDRKWPYDEQFLCRALLLLQEAESMLMEEYRPVVGYHAIIREVRDVLADAGGNVALHEASALVGFLSGIEAACPGLIFPPETDTTERARFRYAERALKGR